MSRKKPSLEIVIDTREQLPYPFKGATKGTLPTGDYSIKGMESQIAIERKRPEELYSCCGIDRPRFKRELARLAGYDYAAIIIEGRLSDLLMPGRFSQLSPKVIINSLISWTIKYKVHVFFAESREYGRALTLRILEKYFAYRTEYDADEKRNLGSVPKRGSG